jgi:exosortase/archaeosortase family protein
MNTLWSVLCGGTLHSVAFVLRALGVPVVANGNVLSSPSFSVCIWPACSGVEGLAVVTVLLCFYLYGFKDRLRFPHALVLLPVGLAMSWALNVWRISVLFLIGEQGYSNLTVEGFHGHAGWVAFCMVAVALIAASKLAWFRSAGVLTEDEARRIASNIAKLPTLIGKES